MTLIWAYIELFIRGKSPGGNVWIPLLTMAFALARLKEDRCCCSLCLEEQKKLDSLHISQASIFSTWHVSRIGACQNVCFWLGLLVLFVKAGDQIFAQQRSASSMITTLDVNTFSCRYTNCSSLPVRPFMSIEFFCWVLPVAESVWSDINIEQSINRFWHDLPSSSS